MLLELHGDSQARVDVAPYENLPKGPGSEAFMGPVAVGDQGGGHGRSCREEWGRGGVLWCALGGVPVILSFFGRLCS